MRSLPVPVTEQEIADMFEAGAQIPIDHLFLSCTLDIEAPHLSLVLCCVSRPECADRNKSGRLSYREFQLMVNSILAII